MAQRPDSFNTTTPTGASSPRQGDDELRNIKLYTQNGWNDLTADDRVGGERHPLYCTAMTNSGNATVAGNHTVSGIATNATTTTTGTNTASVYASSQSGASVGVYKVEARSAGTPVAGDFGTGVNLILQY